MGVRTVHGCVQYMGKNSNFAYAARQGKWKMYHAQGEQISCISVYTGI